MKKILFIYCLLFFNIANGETLSRDGNVILKINYEYGKKYEEYKVIQENIDNNKKYIMHSTALGAKNASIKILSESEFKLIHFKSNRILWKNTYKKRSLTSSCKGFAQIKSKEESTLVCEKNMEMVGETIGLLHLLNKIKTR